MKQKNNLPNSREQWMLEISGAFNHAVEEDKELLENGTIYYGDLYQKSPIICLENRSIQKTKKNIQTAESAVHMNFDKFPEDSIVYESPELSFAFGYLASHFGLKLIEHTLLVDVFNYLVSNLEKLESLTYTSSFD